MITKRNGTIEELQDKVTKALAHNQVGSACLIWLVPTLDKPIAVVEFNRPTKVFGMEPRELRLFIAALQEILNEMGPDEGLQS